MTHPDEIRRDEIRRNLDHVRERLQNAEKRAGRAAGSVSLIAVSKTMPPDDVQAALAAGQRDFGENYAQEFRDKRRALDGSGACWHFIGPLQTNKVKYVAGTVSLVHALDSLELLVELDRRLAASPDAPPQRCLVQVNVAAEPQKRGIPPTALPALLDGFAALPRLRCVGLMVIPPLNDDPEGSRAHFATLRRLRDDEARRPRSGVELTELSMGMSCDLEVAVAEGATMIRIGTAIFGERRR